MWLRPAGHQTNRSERPVAVPHLVDAVPVSDVPTDVVLLLEFLLAAIENWLESYPVDVERFAVDPAKPNLLETLPGEADRTLLFNGHLDTLPFDADAWSYDPLGERVDGRLYGRGTADMKGSLAAMVIAIEAFAETGTTSAVALHFAFKSDEEIGGDAGLSALVSANRFDADACVIGEPTCEEGRHSVTVADRGSTWLTLGAQGDAAPDSRPILGENAIDRIYAAVETIRDRFGRR